MWTCRLQPPPEYVAVISTAFVQADKDPSQMLISLAVNVVLNGYK